MAVSITDFKWAMYKKKNLHGRLSYVRINKICIPEAFKYSDLLSKGDVKLSTGVTSIYVVC